MTNTENILQKAKAAYAEGKTEEVLAILAEQNLEDAPEVLLLKGEVCYQLQKWGDSLNYFNKLIEKNPEDQKAQSYIQMIQNILSFFHTDFFNP